MKKSSIFTFVAVSAVLAAAVMTGRPWGHPAPKPQALVGGLSVPAYEHKAEPVTLDPVVIVAEAPKPTIRALPQKRHQCYRHALKVQHILTTNTDVQIKGDSSVLICD